jgi:hypothetical protein
MISRDELDRLLALYRASLSARSEMSRLLAMGIDDRRAEEADKRAHGDFVAFALELHSGLALEEGEESHG